MGALALIWKLTGKPRDDSPQAEEVFDPSENFWVCIFWDVVFHLTLATATVAKGTWGTWKTWDWEVLSSVMP